MILADSYRDRTVAITGVTGFKGAWLANWLLDLGAQVAGFADTVPTKPALFDLTGLSDRIDMRWGDLRDGGAVTEFLAAVRPSVVFHLGAQALVSVAYAEPKRTFDTNVGGTVNVLEALRRTPGIEAAVLITSDKCYLNVEWEFGYRETDRLGGRDPYSASKAAAEVAIATWYASFLKSDGPAIASARAGNVIGGGDWAKDRIVPDCVRAWSQDASPRVRRPAATRPWQHVLEPLSGYLWLGSRLLAGAPGCRGEAFNFGPHEHRSRTVAELLAALASHWPGRQWEQTADTMMPEATLLKLCCDRAAARLDWQATLDFAETARFTAEWYRAWHEGRKDLAAATRAQVHDYTELARQRDRAWIREKA